MRAKAAFICLSFGLFLSATAVLNAQTTLIEHYVNKDFDCAIFPTTYPSELEGTPFVPNHSEVDRACLALKSKLKDAPGGNKDNKQEIVKNIKKYKVQVFGIVDKKGNKMLFLNCFRNDGNSDKELADSWLRDLIEVENGGVNFWSVKYDLVRDEFSDFNDKGSK